MERDTNRMRGERPWTFTNLKAGDGLRRLLRFWKRKGCCGCSAVYCRVAAADPA
jgi:Ni2+-binding GTPase involved in maturation of urease and hydrogenase